MRLCLTSRNVFAKEMLKFMASMGGGKYIGLHNPKHIERIFLSTFSKYFFWSIHLARDLGLIVRETYGKSKLFTEKDYHQICFSLLFSTFISERTHFTNF